MTRFETSLFIISFFSLLFFFPFRLLAAVEVPGALFLQPAKWEVRLVPGQTADRAFTLSNTSSFDLQIKLSLDSLGIEEENATADSHSLKPNLIFTERELLLKAGASQSIHFTLRTSTSSALGDRFGTLVFSAAKVGESVLNGATAVSRLGGLVFLTIGGEEKASGQLSGFGVANQHFFISFQNDGNIHLNPYGLIEIKDWRRAVVQTVPIYPWFVLPESQRTKEIVSPQFTWPGPYYLHLTLHRGYGQHTDEAEATFWYRPKAFWIFLTLILGAVLGFGWWFHRVLKWRS